MYKYTFDIWNVTKSLLIFSNFTNEKSLLFDGVDEYINCGRVISTEGATEQSFSFWYKSPLTKTSYILAHRNNVNANGFWIYVTAGGAIQVYQFTTAGAVATYTTNLISANTWYHIVVTFNGSNSGNDKFRLYLNGNIETRSAMSGTFQGSLTTDTTSFYIQKWGTATQYGEGNVDEVSIYDYELNSGQVTSIYNSGSPTDLNNTSGVTAPVHWWRMGDVDTYPTITDVGTTGGNDGTMTNMELTDIVSDVP